MTPGAIVGRTHSGREPFSGLRTIAGRGGRTSLQTTTDAEDIASSDDDPERFGLLFYRHFPAIHRYVNRRVGPDLADDLASETFAIAFRRRATYDMSQGDARPWLFGIATNLVRSHRRTERRRLAAYARTAVDHMATTPEFEAAEERVRAARARPSLALALAALPPEHRDALLLFAWADLSYQEIAQALNCPVGTVRSRLARARTRLRELLAASGQMMDETDSF